MSEDSPISLPADGFNPHLEPVPVYIFVDLDDSLFSSIKKCLATDALNPAAILKSGEAISFTTAIQRRFISWLRHDAIVIPVTARSIEAFSRVLLPFDAGAIVGFGASILNAAGRSDPEWREYMQGQLRQSQPCLEELKKLIDSFIYCTDVPLTVRVQVEDGMTQYVVIKAEGDNRNYLTEVARVVLQPWVSQNPGFRYFVNDRIVTVLPPNLDKKIAVAKYITDLRAKYGHVLTIGLGDSLSDIGFMHECDYAVVPTRSQIMKSMRSVGQLD